MKNDRTGRRSFPFGLLVNVQGLAPDNRPSQMKVVFQPLFFSWFPGVLNFQGGYVDFDCKKRFSSS